MKQVRNKQVGHLRGESFFSLFLFCLLASGGDLPVYPEIYSIELCFEPGTALF